MEKQSEDPRTKEKELERLGQAAPAADVYEPDVLHPLFLERQLIEGLVDGANAWLDKIRSRRAEGGIAIAITEACFNPFKVLGAEVAGLKSETELFGEGPSTVIVSAAACHVKELRRIFEPLEVSVLRERNRTSQVQNSPGN